MFLHNKQLFIRGVIKFFRNLEALHPNGIFNTICLLPQNTLSRLFDNPFLFFVLYFFFMKIAMFEDAMTKNIISSMETILQQDTTFDFLFTVIQVKGAKGGSAFSKIGCQWKCLFALR